MIKETFLNDKEINKYGKFFLASEADELPTFSLDTPPAEEPIPEEQPPVEGEEPPAFDIGAEPVGDQPITPRNMKIIEIKPRRIERFKLTDPDEDEMFDTPVDDMSSPMDTMTDDIGTDEPPTLNLGDDDVPMPEPVNTDTDTPPTFDINGGQESQGTGIDEPPTFDLGGTEPPVDNSVPPVPTDMGTGEAPPPTDMSTPPVDNSTPPTMDNPVPPPTDVGAVPPPPMDMGGDNGAVIDDQTPDFGADMGGDTMPPDNGASPPSSGPGLEYDSTRKYVLFKNYISLSNAINNYISKLEVSMGNDTDETVVLKNATDKLREIDDLCYDFITMKFEISTYIQSLFFFQNLVVMVQKVFDLLARSKKKLKNTSSAKKH